MSEKEKTRAQKRKLDKNIDDDVEMKRPHFPPVRVENQETGVQIQKIAVPAHRYTPLREQWMKIYTPIVEQLHLQLRFHLQSRNVELRTCSETKDSTHLQKGADFVRAFILGFDVEDAIALVRLDELFIDTFDIRDVKPLKGDHLSRAIGRLAGKNGKTKFTLENSTRTRIVVADSRVHILGAYANLQAAKGAICQLVLGSRPSTVYGKIKNVSCV